MSEQQSRFNRIAGIIGGLTAIITAITGLLLASDQLRNQVCLSGLPAPWCNMKDDYFSDDNVFKQIKEN